MKKITEYIKKQFTDTHKNMSVIFVICFLLVGWIIAQFVLIEIDKVWIQQQQAKAKTISFFMYSWGFGSKFVKATLFPNKIDKYNSKDFRNKLINLNCKNSINEKFINRYKTGYSEDLFLKKIIQKSLNITKLDDEIQSAFLISQRGFIPFSSDYKILNTKRPKIVKLIQTKKNILKFQDKTFIPFTLSFKKEKKDQEWGWLVLVYDVQNIEKIRTDIFNVIVNIAFILGSIVIILFRKINGSKK